MKKLERNEKTRASYYRNPYYDKELWHFAPFPSEYTRDGVIQYLIDTNLVEWYITKLLRRRIDDYKTQEYVQECWLQILKIKDERLKELWYQGYPAVTAFVSGLIHQNVVSVQSPAYWHVFKCNKRLIHVDGDIWDEVSDYTTYPDTIKEILINEDNKIDNWHELENTNTKS